MTLQQLEYIVAIDTWRHFVTAAEKTFVTQATLSMMVKKLEDELDLKIFDRSRQPVVPTETGKKIVAHARVVLHEARRIHEIVKEEKGVISGELRVGIIPTLAPYLLPLFINDLVKKYPLIQLRLYELTTGEIIRRLEQHDIDVGILATPLQHASIIEQPLFYEQFVVYAAPEEQLMQKKRYILAGDIDVNRLWLLEEGHCLRSQVINLCELKTKEKALHQLDFEAGSIETLKKMIDVNGGITILPELALNDLDEEQLEQVRFFKSPAPVREISLVTYRHFVKEKLVAVLRETILAHVPATMHSMEKKAVVDL